MTLRNQNLCAALANPEDPPTSSEFTATSSRASTAWLLAAGQRRKTPRAILIVKKKRTMMRMTMTTSETTPKMATISSLSHSPAKSANDSVHTDASPAVSGSGSATSSSSRTSPAATRWRTIAAGTSLAAGPATSGSTTKHSSSASWHSPPNNSPFHHVCQALWRNTVDHDGTNPVVLAIDRKVKDRAAIHAATTMQRRRTTSLLSPVTTIWTTSRSTK